MLLMSLALAQAAASAPPRLDIACTAMAEGRTQQWHFSIDARAARYSGDQNGSVALGGRASVNEARIVLLNEQEQITWYYHINRNTGVLTVAGGLNGHSRVFNQTRGTCQL